MTAAASSSTGEAMKSFVYLAMASIACGVAGCKKETASNTPATPNAPATAPTVGQKVDNAISGAGQTIKNAKDDVTAKVAPSGSSDLSGIRSVLEDVVDNAL